MQFWVGVSFGAALILILTIALFTQKNLSDGQLKILRILASICAGFCGGLLSGDLFVQFGLTPSPSMELAGQASAGFGLFVLVLFTFGSVVHPADAFNFSVPQGWTFKQTAEQIAMIDDALAKFSGFSDAQLSAKLAPRELHTASASSAVKSLRKLADVGAVPEYTVRRTDTEYVLTARS
jgi:hypothetical protein